VVDFGGGDIDEAGLIGSDIKASDGAKDLAALVENGEPVPQDGRVGCKGSGDQEWKQRGNQCELYWLLHPTFEISVKN
jgi:hypothetical protein